MVRSLIIRQIFRFMDMALVIAVIASGTVAVRQFFLPMPTVDIDEALLYPDEVEAANLVRGPGERREYDGVINSGLFGPAGRWDPDAVPPPAPVQPEIDLASDIEDSDFDLVLRGTIALEPGDPFSVAFIENVEKREDTRSYLLGQEVLEDVFLDVVYQREVILLNKRSNPPQRERLRMEDANPEKASAPRAMAASSRGAIRPQPGPGASPAVQAPSSAVDRITVNREELMQEVMANYSELSRITPVIARDDAGNVLGVTADNIGQQSMARKFGFEESDIVQTVNNERIDSEEKILEILQKYQNANSFRVGILRNGRPHVLTYRVE